MNGFVENICRKVYEEKRGIITDPDQIKQCYITDDFPKATVENTEGRKEYRIYMDFDKKNEFPKVKLNLPKFDFSHLTEAVRNMNSAFENMIKDTQEQKDKDNAMAMEFTKCIGELLRKNGVVPKITEYTHESVKENSIEQLYGVSIEELDFSEHDKVFEDKIAELKKDYKTASELLGKYQQENESLKKRIIELENFSCQAEQETESLVEKLKQRIAELEQSRSERIDKAVEWQHKCEKLESKETVDLPFDPLECANYLINATYERETSSLERGLKGLPEKVDSDRYTVGDLEQIAEHLLVYCKHNKEGEA